jgi:hypothetical protein
LEKLVYFQQNQWVLEFSPGDFAQNPVQISDIAGRKNRRQQVAIIVRLRLFQQFLELANEALDIVTEFPVLNKFALGLFRRDLRRYLDQMPGKSAYVPLLIGF